VNERLILALRIQGIEQLYSHQAASFVAVSRGEHIVVVTPTASGKTLCYNLPVINALLCDPSATALYLFPTKALAQDQLAELNSLFAGIHNGVEEEPVHILPSLSAATYDGDTPAADRPRIRETARLLISNPDMLHTGILPHHTRWARFFSGLRYVVLDELHTYRGLFGSHVANVLRRLRRICAFYGCQPQFICCSATIANPEAHARRLVGEPVTLIADNGAPSGERHFIFYNPPLVDRQLGLRRSPVLEAQRLAREFILADLQTIIFARARLTVEVLLTYLRRFLQDQGQSTGLVRGYRGGYLPRERRAIERGLREGQVRAVVSTNALELGIDIGQLAVCIMTGYPGTIASTWQQAGRAGRTRDVAAAILVAGGSPLDQYLITHPQYLLERSPEHALINPDNLSILINHLQCAAFEVPFESCEGGTSYFGEDSDIRALLDYLVEAELVRHSGQRWYWIGESYPAEAVSLRTAGLDNFVVQDMSGLVPRAIGHVDRASAPFLIHEGAIYFHEGQQYLVERLDWEGRRAEVQPVDVDYYTDASVAVDVRVQRVWAEAMSGGVHKAYGEALVISKPTVYRKIRLYTHENLGWGEINLPEQEMLTAAYWFAIEETVLERLRAEGAWNADPVYRGPNWESQRELARARDGYRCRHCGAPERPDRQHDVHHLKPFRSFGYAPGKNENYKTANALDNLITLCHDCHRRAEAAQHVRSGLSGLAYALGHLAPLYLMCDPRDLGVMHDVRSSFTKAPTVYIYEKVPGGVGFSEQLFAGHEDLLAAAQELVTYCPCEAGCPACVGPVTDEGHPTRRDTLLLITALQCA